jgi:hypothetical protein
VFKSSQNLIKDGELRLVVEEARHSKALLLAQTEDIRPVSLGIPSSLSINQVLYVHLSKQLAQTEH